MEMPLKVSLVVAACNNKGIGAKGQLPWRIREDMAFFKKITSETKDKDKQNAVIMGRKTWNSIPAKFQPLPNRINIIISRTMTVAPPNTYLAPSFDKAMDLLQSPELKAKVENSFITGGGSIYKLALDSGHCHRIYMTRVLADFECDAFMPDFDTAVFQKINVAHIPSEKKTENGIDFQFEVYERVQQQDK